MSVFLAMNRDTGGGSDLPLHAVFRKGTSRRIYGELYKVIDSSDVIIHVVDARDPLGVSFFAFFGSWSCTGVNHPPSLSPSCSSPAQPTARILTLFSLFFCLTGTLCESTLEWIRKEKGWKQIVIVINKCDLVPNWVTVSLFSPLSFLYLFVPSLPLERLEKSLAPDVPIVSPVLTLCT
jgi:nuclear GTP-binding protein